MLMECDVYKKNHRCKPSIITISMIPKNDGLLPGMIFLYKDEWRLQVCHFFHNCFTVSYVNQ
jgi:hypothetical protein